MVIKSFEIALYYAQKQCVVCLIDGEQFCWSRAVLTLRAKDKLEECSLVRLCDECLYCNGI